MLHRDPTSLNLESCRDYSLSTKQLIASFSEEPAERCTQRFIPVWIYLSCLTPSEIGSAASQRITAILGVSDNGASWYLVSFV